MNAHTSSTSKLRLFKVFLSSFSTTMRQIFEILKNILSTWYISCLHLNIDSPIYCNRVARGCTIKYNIHIYVNPKNGTCTLAQGSMPTEIRTSSMHDLIYNINPTLSTLRISKRPGTNKIAGDAFGSFIQIGFI